MYIHILRYVCDWERKSEDISAVCYAAGGPRIQNVGNYYCRECTIQLEQAAAHYAMTLFEFRSLYGWRALSLSDAWQILLLHNIRGRNSQSPYVWILRCVVFCVRVSWNCFVLLIGKTFWCKWFFVPYLFFSMFICTLMKVNSTFLNVVYSLNLSILYIVAQNHCKR